MATIVFAIAVVVLFFWILQSIRLYRNCKGDIYNDIYGSFFAYAYRYVAIRDCSTSGYLKQQIGTHRIVFSTVTQESGEKTKFCVIIYERGIMIICYDKATGEFRGNPSAKYWNVIRTDSKGVAHAYKHLNPTQDMVTYVRRIAEFFPDVHIEARLGFNNSADFSKLKSDITCIHFNEIVENLKMVTGDLQTEDDIKAEYNKLVT